MNPFDNVLLYFVSNVTIKNIEQEGKVISNVMQLR